MANEENKQQQEKVEEKSRGTYEASCHCGYIKFALTISPSLDTYEVLECNCSACRRLGYLLICEFSIYILSLLS